MSEGVSSLAGGFSMGFQAKLYSRFMPALDSFDGSGLYETFIGLCADAVFTSRGSFMVDRKIIKS